MSSKEEISEEFCLLCMMHNIGATLAEKSLSVQEIVEWTSMEPSTVHFHLQKLVEVGYVKLIEREGVERYYLTPDGIRKVLSLYS